jgi:transcriptional regulator with XRE-family HTH domain
MTNHELGKMLKNKRKEHGLSQQYVAERSAITRQTLSKLENGVWGSGVSLLSLVKVLEVLDLEFIIKEKSPFNFDL